MGDTTLERYVRTYPAGAVLFREGETGHEMYVIQSGEVEISRRTGERSQVLAVLPAGEFFGEMALVNNRPRSATAVVRHTASLLVIDARTFEAMLRARSEIAVRMIKTMASRLERANSQLELLLLRDANHRVVQCLRQLAEEQMSTGAVGPGSVFIPVSAESLQHRVALPASEVQEVLERLAVARLVVPARAAGLERDGVVVPEVGRLMEFLEFLELKERFGAR